MQIGAVLEQVIGAPIDRRLPFARQPSPGRAPTHPGGDQAAVAAQDLQQLLAHPLFGGFVAFTMQRPSPPRSTPGRESDRERDAFAIRGEGENPARCFNLGGRGCSLALVEGLEILRRTLDQPLRLAFWQVCGGVILDRRHEFVKRVLGSLDRRHAPDLVRVMLRRQVQLGVER